MAAPPGVYVSRPSVWGNPYVLGEVCQRCEQQHDEPGSTIECFEQWLLEMLVMQPSFLDALDGKTLLCTGCAPGLETCHARVYERFIAHAAEEGGCLRGGVDCDHGEEEDEGGEEE